MRAKAWFCESGILGMISSFLVCVSCHLRITAVQIYEKFSNFIRELKSGIKIKRLGYCFFISGKT